MDFNQNEKTKEKKENKENKVTFFHSLNLFKNFKGFKEINENQIELHDHKAHLLSSLCNFRTSSFDVIFILGHIFLHVIFLSIFIQWLNRFVLYFFLFGLLQMNGNDNGSSKKTIAEKPNDFDCNECSNAYKTKSRLNRDIKNRHMAEKRLSCAICSKGFNDGFDLKRHIRTHTGVQPYKCDDCEKAFTQLGSLESHRLKIHNIATQYGFKEKRAKVTYVQNRYFLK